MTSEEKLEIPPQPQPSCRRINQAIKDVRKAIFYAKSAIKAIEEEDTKSMVEDIESSLCGLEDDFEFCRSQAEDIREWGDEWKVLAKRLVQEYEPERLEE